MATQALRPKAVPAMARRPLQATVPKRACKQVQSFPAVCYHYSSMVRTIGLIASELFALAT